MIERIVDRIEAADVRDWSVYLSSGRRVSLGTKNARTGSVHVPLSVGESVGASYLLVWDDGRVSRGSWEHRQLDDLGPALDRARSAAFDDPDAAQVCGPAEMPEVELHAADTAAVVDGDLDWLVRRLAEVRRAFAAASFKTWLGSFSASVGRSRLVTSAGLDVRGRGTSAGWHVGFEGRVGVGRSARGLDEDEVFAERIDRLADWTQALARSGGLPAGNRGAVMLHPQVVESFVLGTLFHNLSGSTVFHDEGHFPRESFGGDEAVLRDDFELSIDPLQPLASGSYRFTSEGVPARRTVLVANGRLRSPVLDLKYARRLESKPTAVPYAMDAVRMELGRRLPLDEAWSDPASPALVLSVLGTHTQDPASGDFSLSAPQTLVRSGDGIAGCRVNISGNLFEALRSPGAAAIAFPHEPTPGLILPCRIDPT